MGKYFFAYIFPQYKLCVLSKNICGNTCLGLTFYKKTVNISINDGERNTKVRKNEYFMCFYSFLPVFKQITHLVYFYNRRNLGLRCRDWIVLIFCILKENEMVLFLLFPFYFFHFNTLFRLR